METETVIFLTLAVIAGYVMSLWLWPFTACGRCGGDGKNAGSNRKRWGACRKCGGSGRKTRLGARIVFRRD